MTPLAPPNPYATPPVAMSIAGSDASGGAGIQADLRTFAAHGVHGTTAISAVTAQNTVGVQGVHALPAEFVAAQITSITDDLHVGAVKTGMLANADIVLAVAEAAEAGRLPNLVVDPVMVASTGARLLDDGAETAYRTRLVPAATLIAPNVAEAGVLLGTELTGADDLADAAAALAHLGPSVLITGGDGGGGTGDERTVADTLALHGRSGIEVFTATAPRVATRNDHGSGCSLSSATAALLARGDTLLDAIAGARAFVRRALIGGAVWHLGAGHGPLDHLGWVPVHDEHDPLPAPVHVRTIP